MKTRHTMAALLLAAASTHGLAGGGPLDLSTGSTGFASTPAAGPFTDLWTFTLSMAASVSASLTAVVNGGQDVDLSLVQIIGASTTLNFTQLLSDPVETWALAATTLPAGSYTLSITGTNSAAAGSYGGNVAVSPVSEPETYAMLAAGLMGVGFVLRRRR